MKVGFFDSGLGGLTVLKEAIENEKLREEVYYLGDTKNTPYGTKDEKYVQAIIEDNIKYLIDLGCNPIVIACNTATTLSIKYLRSTYPSITFIGTEPAVKVAADAHKNKKILVLATSITVKQEKLLNLIDVLNIKENVELRAADKLVEFAEDINCLKRQDEVEEYISDVLKDYNLKEYSHIVLGCTHFPLFRQNFQNVIERICPEACIEVVDGAKGISKNLMNKLEELRDGENNKESSIIHVITTKESNAFNTRTREILGYNNIIFQNKLQ